MIGVMMALQQLQHHGLLPYVGVALASSRIWEAHSLPLLWLSSMFEIAPFWDQSALWVSIQKLAMHTHAKKEKFQTSRRPTEGAADLLNPP